MILIVDDLADNCNLLRRLLRLSGYEAESAPGGREALELIRGRAAGARPKLVLMDQMMPELTGLETLALMRSGGEAYQLEGGRPIPVVMVSAVDEPELRTLASALGAGAWVVKGKLGWKDQLAVISRNYGQSSPRMDTNGHE